MNARARILVVDDERSMRDFLEIAFRRAGYEVLTAADADAALVAVESDDIDVVISDMQMPGKSGLDLLRLVKNTSPDTAMVMITAYASTDSAIDALKEGATDYVTKPFKIDELEVVVERALEKKLLASENRRLRSELRSQARSRTIIGTSDAMQRVYELVSQVAATKTNVLISGESGTGKELVARAIHDQSERGDQAFVAVNCGAIPENLLESELFGHAKGAFTGAGQRAARPLRRPRTAARSFSTRSASCSQALQVKLLRVLQEEDGAAASARPRPIQQVDVRRDRSHELATLEPRGGRRPLPRRPLLPAQRHAPDRVPPLRERTRRHPAAHATTSCRQLRDRASGSDVQTLTEAMPWSELVREYAWPGNVRELENVIERAVALSNGSEIGVDVLPASLSERPAAGAGPRITTAGVDLDALMAEYEGALLKEALRVGGGVKKRAAQLLGISFRSFRYRLEKLGLDDADADPID